MVFIDYIQDQSKEANELKENGKRPRQPSGESENEPFAVSNYYIPNVISKKEGNNIF